MFVVLPTNCVVEICDIEPGQSNVLPTYRHPGNYWHHNNNYCCSCVVFLVKKIKKN